MEEASFETIFRQNFQVLLNIANTVVKDRDVAKDIVQQVFYKLWQNRSDVNIKSMRSYLHRAVINTSLNHIEKHKRLIHVDDDQLLESEMEVEQLSDNHINYDDMSSMVQSAVDELPPRCKLVFSLSRFEGLDNKEIAEYMDTSLKTVENQMGKALKILRGQLRGLLDNKLISVGFIFFIIKRVAEWVLITLALS